MSETGDAGEEGSPAHAGTVPGAYDATDGWPDSVDYGLDLDPIRVRDPVADVLGVTRPGQAFEVSYADVVKLAGHSCPAAAGGFRIAAAGLAALYPDSVPVRSDVTVHARGPPDDQRYGVTSRILSYVTGATDERGFGGLAGGFGNRRNRLVFDDATGEETDDPAGDAETDSDTPEDTEGDGPGPITYVLERTDTGRRVEVRYHVGDLPPLGDARAHLPALVEGTASDDQRETFLDAWHARVRAALGDDRYLSVEVLDDGE